MVEVRPEERRPVIGAFFTLFGVMCGHALVETARDALFLAEIPPQRLPLVYLAIAALALLTNRLYEKALRRVCPRTFLSVSLLLVAAGAFGLWWLIGRGGQLWIYVLYVWSGIATMVLVVRFWSSLADRFTSTQAKRLFAPIGAGSVSGAILGAAIARAITEVDDARELLLAASVAFVVSALIAWISTPPAGEADGEEEPIVARTDLRLVFRQPYIVRLLVWMVLATMTFTIADFIFKYVAAERVAPEGLGSFFADCYLAFHLISLLMQFTVVTVLVRSWGLHRVVGFPGILLALGGLATIGIGLAVPAWILFCAVGIKSIDGALRHSLHRTATEMLFVPLSREVRARSKAFLDVAGHRGGQAISSLLILGLTATPWDLWALVAVLIVLGGAWVAMVYELRDHYLNLFRDTLRNRNFQTSIEFPSLDLASLESLIATLNSSDDPMVNAALDLLEEQGRARLIPALILYHPSPDVAVHALDLFGRNDRDDVIPVARRLLKHEEPRVRAAALRALSAIDREGESPMEQFLDDDSPAVRATALISLIGLGWLEPEQGQQALESFANSADAEERLALAEAIAQRPDELFLPTLLRLARDADESIAGATAGAFRRLRHPGALPALLPMLARRRLREEARRAIEALTPTVSDQLAEALADANTPIDIRRHLPRTMMRFPPDEVAHALLAQLIRDNDGVVRFKIIRALETIRSRFPHVDLDRELLEQAVERTLAGAYRLADWKLQLERGLRKEAARATPVAELMAHTLDHKRQHSIGRLFRLLGLLYPDEDFRRIHEGLRSDKAARRSSSLELIEATVDPPTREYVLALVDDRSDQSRVIAGAQLHPPLLGGYEELLNSMLSSGGVALRCLAAYHVGELGIRQLSEPLHALRRRADVFVSGVVERAIALLDEKQRGVANE